MKFLFTLLVFFCIFDFGFLSRWFGMSRFLARAPFVLSLFIGGILLMGMAMHKIIIPRKIKTVRICLLFFISITFLSLFSVLINRGDLVLGLYELRYYFMLCVIVVAGVVYFKDSFKEESFIKFLVVIGLIQIPVTLIQYGAVKYFGVRLSPTALDMASGTFSTYSTLVFNQTFCVCMVMAWTWVCQKKILRMPNYLLSILLVVPLFFSFSRAALGLLVISITSTVILVWTKKKYRQSIKKHLMPMVLFMMIVFVGFYFIFWQGNKDEGSMFSVEEQFRLDYIVKYFDRAPDDYHAYKEGAHGVMGRWRSVTESARLISKNPVTFFVGVGPDAVNEALFLNRQGRFKYSYGSLAGIGRTQIARNICNFGFFGILLFVWFFNSILKRGRDQKNNKYSAFYYLVMQIFISMMLLFSFYSPILNSNFIIFILGLSLAFISKREEGLCA